MKAFLKILIIVFLFSGLFASMQSCENILSGTKDSGIPELTINEEIQVNSGTSSSDQVETITNCNLNGWEIRNQPGALGTVTLVNGPAKPALGQGSLEFNSPDTKIVRLRSNSLVGTPVSAFTELFYSTYIQSRTGDVDDAFIVLQIDIDGDSRFDFPIVFNPEFNTGHYVAGIGTDQGPTLLNTWQTWDLLHGLWWKNLNDIDPDSGAKLFTLDMLVQEYPNAAIGAGGAGAIRINGGAPIELGGFLGPFTGNVDNLRIGINGLTTVYDFEETTANAGPDQNVILGYGPDCATLTGIAEGGVAPYSYSWSPGGSTRDQASTEVCPEFTTTYTLTVTDANGCNRTDKVTVFVNDVRCGNKMDKVKVCHKGKEICIESKDVEDHLAHGDVLGGCKTSN